MPLSVMVDNTPGIVDGGFDRRGIHDTVGGYDAA